MYRKSHLLGYYIIISKSLSTGDVLALPAENCLRYWSISAVAEDWQTSFWQTGMAIPVIDANSSVVPTVR